MKYYLILKNQVFHLLCKRKRYFNLWNLKTLFFSRIIKAAENFLKTDKSFNISKENVKIASFPVFDNENNERRIGIQFCKFKTKLLNLKSLISPHIGDKSALEFIDAKNSISTANFTYAAFLNIDAFNKLDKRILL
jgi:hypothetical protein